MLSTLEPGDYKIGQGQNEDGKGYHLYVRIRPGNQVPLMMLYEMDPRGEEVVHAHFLGNLHKQTKDYGVELPVRM